MRAPGRPAAGCGRQYHAERVDEAKAAEGGRPKRRVPTRSDRRADAGAGRRRGRRISSGGQQVSLLRPDDPSAARRTGVESVQRADLVRPTSPIGAQSSTMDRFLDELDSMAPLRRSLQWCPSMRSPAATLRPPWSRGSTAVVAGLRRPLSTLSDEFVGGRNLLCAEPILARHLAEASGETEAKSSCCSVLFGRPGPRASRCSHRRVRAVVVADRRLVDAVEHIAWLEPCWPSAERDAAGPTRSKSSCSVSAGSSRRAEPQLTTLLGIPRQRPGRASCCATFSTAGIQRHGRLRPLCSRQTVTLLRGNGPTRPCRIWPNWRYRLPGRDRAEVSAQPTCPTASVAGSPTSSSAASTTTPVSVQLNGRSRCCWVASRSPSARGDRRNTVIPAGRSSRQLPD